MDAAPGPSSAVPDADSMDDGTPSALAITEPQGTEEPPPDADEETIAKSSGGGGRGWKEGGMEGKMRQDNKHHNS